MMHPTRVSFFRTSEFDDHVAHGIAKDSRAGNSDGASDLLSRDSRRRTPAFGPRRTQFGKKRGAAIAALRGRKAGFLQTALFCIAVLCGFSSVQAHADALADIQKRGSLRVAVPQDFAPFGSVGPSMQLEGLDIDVAKMIADKLGVKLETVPVTTANRIPYLQTHKTDLVISTLGEDAERDKVIDFSQAYSPYNNSVYGAANVKVTGPVDLADKTVGVARSTFEDLMLTKSVPASTTLKRFEDNNGLISAYLSGQVTLLGTGDFVANKIAASLPPTSQSRPVLKYVIHESACKIGLNKSEPALLAKVNGILTQSKKDGSLNAIVEKWLHVPLPQSMAAGA